MSDLDKSLLIWIIGLLNMIKRTSSRVIRKCYQDCLLRESFIGLIKKHRSVKPLANTMEFVSFVVLFYWLSAINIRLHRPKKTK